MLGRQQGLGSGMSVGSSLIHFREHTDMVGVSASSPPVSTLAELGSRAELRSGGSSSVSM